MQSIKSSQVLILVGVLVAVVITFSFTTIFQATPPSAPALSKVLSEPKTIGVLFATQNVPVVTGLKEGLKELGYTNITFKEVEIPTGPTIMADVDKQVKILLKNGVDLIYTPVEYEALGAIKATKEMGNNTPIVFLSSFHEPVAYGLAQSFTSSGNNATGVSANIFEIMQKQLEFLRKIRPDSKKIGVFGKGFVVTLVGDEFLAQLKKQAPRLGFEVVEYTTDAPPPKAEQAWQTIAATIKPGDIDALYHIAGHFYPPQEVAESALATRLKIPMVAPPQDLPNGGHFGYNSDFMSAGKQTAKMVDKIFRGAKPTDIPLENVEKISLVIYPVRAQTADVVFPESIRSIADKIVNDK